MTAAERGHPAVTSGPDGWERVHSPTNHRKIVYWRRPLADGTRLTVSRAPMERWVWRHYRGTKLLRTSDLSWRNSVSARRAVDSLFRKGSQ